MSKRRTAKNDDGSFLGLILLGLVGYGVYAQAKAKQPLEQMKTSILAQATDQDVRRKVAELTKGCYGNEVLRIERIYRFVADQIDYMPDPWNEDYFSKALETMYVGAGDCDCKSILLATLLRANGFPVALDLVPGHVLVEAFVGPAFVAQLPTIAYRRTVPHTGGAWVLLESTAAGAQIGWVDGTLYQQHLSAGTEQRIEI